MYKLTLIPLLLLFVASLGAQDASVEKSISSLQFNLSELRFVQESALGNYSTIRLEVGTELNGRLSLGRNAFRDNFLGIRPLVGIGARNYYNLNNREADGKNIRNNSGNFVMILAEYRPDFFLWNSDDDRQTDEDPTVSALWGLRRQIGENFDFEFTAGVRLNVDQLRAPMLRTPGRNIQLGWRLGYRF